MGDGPGTDGEDDLVGCREPVGVVALGHVRRQGRGIDSGAVSPRQQPVEAEEPGAIGEEHGKDRPGAIEDLDLDVGDADVPRRGEAIEVGVVEDGTIKASRLLVAKLDAVGDGPRADSERDLVGGREPVGVEALGHVGWQGRGIDSGAVASGEQAVEAEEPGAIGEEDSKNRSGAIEDLDLDVWDSDVSRGRQTIEIGIVEDGAVKAPGLLVAKVDPKRRDSGIDGEHDLVGCGEPIGVVALGHVWRQGRRVDAGAVGSWEQPVEAVEPGSVGGQHGEDRSGAVEDFDLDVGNSHVSR